MDSPAIHGKTLAQFLAEQELKNMGHHYFYECNYCFHHKHIRSTFTVYGLSQSTKKLVSKTAVQ